MANSSNAGRASVQQLPDEEESAKQLGLQYDLRQAEVKTLIDYYKQKDPHNKGLLPHEFKEAAAELIDRLTIDPNMVFNIFDIAESGVHGRVTMREFVLGYAILSRGTTESRLRYLFALGGTKAPNGNISSNADHLTRDQLINCLRLMQRIVSEVTPDDDDGPSEMAAEENDQHILQVADNLIEKESQSRSSKPDCISYMDFIENLKETDVVMSWLERLSTAAGEHLRSIEHHLERDVVELNMEREGIISPGTSAPRNTNFAQMDWSTSSSGSPKWKSSFAKSIRRRQKSIDSALNPNATAALRPTVPHSSTGERKRTVILTRKQQLVRRDGGKAKPTHAGDKKAKHSQDLSEQKRKEHLVQTGGKHVGDGQPTKGDSLGDVMKDWDWTSEQNANASAIDEYDEELIEPDVTTEPFLISYDDIEFGNVLGCGACATVHEGKWLHIPVAVKVFNDINGQPAGIDALASTDEDRRKAKVGDYAKEFWLLLQIRHPNCLLYMGICFEPYVCIVTELFTGGSVANYLHGPNAQKFSPTKALEMISGVARGMYYLHASTPSILHRDLKASNILINRLITHCVICDFGLSIQFARDISGKNPKGGDSRVNIREPGMVGTVYTMAPEVMEGNEYTPAADVYSFGVVMYEIYTGRVPFPNLQPIQIMFHVSDGNRPKFLESDKVPPTLQELIIRCWAHIPEDRPTFKDILEILTDTKLKSEVILAQAAESKLKKPDVNELSKRLLDVAFTGQDDELLQLINAGADINYCDYDKRTALHVAAAEGKVDCMRVLIRLHAKIRRDRWNNTPMVDAMNFNERTKNSEPIRLLREYEGRHFVTDNMDGTGLHVDPEQKQTLKKYSLLIAASQGDVDTIRNLLNEGVDVNLSDYDRRTSLMIAASDGQEEVVKVLLEYGANVLSRDRWGSTAYREAERCGHHEIMSLIRRAEDKSESQVTMSVR